MHPDPNSKGLNRAVKSSQSSGGKIFIIYLTLYCIQESRMCDAGGDIQILTLVFVTFQTVTFNIR